jgi:hypothetical protein
MKCLVVVLALTACSSHAPELRGDWCGTTRAEIAWAGELAEKCDGGDFLACERAEVECKRGSLFFCRTNAPAKTATPVELRARLAPSCDAGKSADCLELAELLVRAGEDPEGPYLRACERGESVACARLGDRISARATAAESAGDWNEAAHLHRLACFKNDVPDECAALEAFRARAKREARECEAGRVDFCERAAGMLRAASQGPADDARANALTRRISR